MSDRELLLQAFERGTLVRPSPTHMSFVDVVRALAHASGVEVPLNEHSRDLASHLRGVQHLVFLLADGMGINLVDRIPRNSWIRRNTRRSIHATFPSTTTTAVTSIATGEHPATHAVAGWWVHLPALRAPATVFLHDRAEDGKSLTDLGLGADDLSPSPPLLPRMTREVRLVVPEGIADSPYTMRMGGDCERIAYRTHGEAVEAIVRALGASAGPTFTYWYTPSPDAEEHDHGVEADRVFNALGDLDEAAETLAEALEDGGAPWRIVGTADHGHLDLDPRLEVAKEDPLLAHLDASPAGDMRVQFWHVRTGAEAEFEAAFQQRFAGSFYLIRAREAEALGLFGPEPWSDVMHRRAGSHVSISSGAAAMRFEGIPGIAGYRRMQSGHSGLSPQEMQVPLIIAGEATSNGGWGI
ncbi:MAG: alkaline phosphatase family protein [Dehalococcoidia bacterium]|nr:alkaline phosphatase family protein [Dehalococcoidia bacterium]